jgi:hypothetical protein
MATREIRRIGTYQIDIDKPILAVRDNSEFERSIDLNYRPLAEIYGRDGSWTDTSTTKSPTQTPTRALRWDDIAGAVPYQPDTQRHRTCTDRSTTPTTTSSVRKYTAARYVHDPEAKGYLLTDQVLANRCRRKSSCGN